MINTEIERRWVLDSSDPTIVEKEFKQRFFNKNKIYTSYLFSTFDPSYQLRFRSIYKVNNEGEVQSLICKMNTKYGSGISRYEYEKEISREDYNGFTHNLKIVETIFYKDDLYGLEWKFNDLLGKNIIVEKEFNNIEEAKNFEFPYEGYKEVTEDSSYNHVNIYKELVKIGKTI